MPDPAIRPRLPDLIDTNPLVLDTAYQRDVYDPRRDVRNQYPVMAQKLLHDEALRAGLTIWAQDICRAGAYGYQDNDRDMSMVRVVALKGFAMGLDFLRAVATIKVINGQLTILGPQALHLIRERTRNATLVCKQSTRDVCVWSLGRPGEKAKDFCRTRAEIEEAGLHKTNHLWDVYPQRLLKWNAFSEGAQELFGDVLVGCYITEEMGMQVQFEEDLDEAAKKARDPSRSRRRSPTPKGKTSRPKQNDGEKQKQGRGQSSPATNKNSKQGSSKTGDTTPQPTKDKPPSEANGTPRPQPQPDTSPKVDQESIKALSVKLGAVAQAMGVKAPSQDMSTEQQRLVKKSWDNEREMIWEEVSKRALDGKVAKSESLTVSEFKRLDAAFDRRLAEAKK